MYSFWFIKIPITNYGVCANKYVYEKLHLLCLLYIIKTFNTIPRTLNYIVLFSLILFIASFCFHRFYGLQSQFVHKPHNLRTTDNCNNSLIKKP